MGNRFDPIINVQLDAVLFIWILVREGSVPSEDRSYEVNCNETMEGEV